MSRTRFVVSAAGLLSALLVVGLLTAALLGPDGIVRHRQLKADLERVRALNDQLRDENRHLAAERDALRHDPIYIDSVIRDDLGYVREDELILQLPTGGAAGQTAGKAVADDMDGRVETPAEAPAPAVEASAEASSGSPSAGASETDVDAVAGQPPEQGPSIRDSETPIP